MDANHSTPLKGEMENQEEKEEKETSCFSFQVSLNMSDVRIFFPPTRDFRAPISLQRVTVDGVGAWLFRHVHTAINWRKMGK